LIWELVTTTKVSIEASVDDGVWYTVVLQRVQCAVCSAHVMSNNRTTVVILVVNWAIDDKQEMIDLIETVYRGARKGRGLVIATKDYSTKYKY
jgi:hypothetical protein